MFNAEISGKFFVLNLLIRPLLGKPLVPNTDIERLRVTKANKLIQVNLSDNVVKFTPREQKLVLAVLSQVEPDDEEFKELVLSVEDIKLLTGVHENDLWKTLRNMCNRVMSSPITIVEPNNPDGFLMLPWFAHAAYSPIQGSCKFSISPKLKPYLLQLQSTFTSYNLSMVMKLESGHSMRVYELLKQYEKIGSRKIAIADLKSMLGIDQHKYKKFNDFKRFVIIQAQKELSKHTDIGFEFKTIRQGRKIGFIHFQIYKIERVEPEPDTLEPDSIDPAGVDPDVADMLRGAIPSISDLSVRALSLGYTPDELVVAVVTLDMSLQAGTVKGSPLAYLMGILKTNRAEEFAERSTSDKSADVDLFEQL